ncbi:MAG TPA: single-stranded DNA-binding protein [Streptosporangiaceae bacterium]|jgi:single-strand DNA-binding protein
MAGETTMTVIGNLTADPELRVTSAGLSVLSCTIASTPRVYDRGSEQWKDGTPLFMRAVVWGPQAEHVAESFQRGSRVIAHGRVSQRSYETSEGDKRTDVELVVDEFGGSARYATLRVSKASRSAERADAGEDPWATPWGSSEPAGAATR